MAATYTGYITEVRRLLHDATGVFWSDTELTDYINSARDRIVRDTGCLRYLAPSSAVYNVETLNLTSLTLPAYAQSILDVLNINLYWGNSRIPLRYLAWTDFNSQLRYWQNYTGRPVGFSLYGPNIVYFGPVPDQTYQIELDTIVLPVALTSDSQTESIPAPYTTCVKFYAAYLAKYKEQSYGEAEIFKAEYTKQAQAAIASSMTRRLPTAFSQPY
ncbi:MAG: hypothetical protein EBT99_15185 [Betaproteobacteria bacterium]|nr:hypothetical protein [Betaproteobacteria bacterium]